MLARFCLNLRGLRLFLFLFAAMLVGCGFLFFGAQVAPRLLIRSGVRAYEGDAREAAAWGHVNARLLACGGGPEAFICTAVRVTEVTPLPADEAEECLEPYPPYSVKLRAYTIFGIPYDTIIYECGTTYRLHHP